MNIIGKGFHAIKIACESQQTIKFDAVKNIVVLNNGEKVDLNQYHTSEQSYIYSLIRPFRENI